MNALTKQYIALIAVILFLSLLAFSHPPEEVPGETMARMMKLGEELATPNKHHAFLNQMSGDWTTTSSVMGMPPSTGTASYTMILGNRYLDGMHDGDYMGVSFVGRLTIGYDNYKHKFIASFIDNLGTSMRVAEGMLDKSGTVLSLWGPVDDWMTDEHDKPAMYRYRIIDDNHFSFEVHDLGMNEHSKVIEVHYERVPTKQQ